MSEKKAKKRLVKEEKSLDAQRKLGVKPYIVLIRNPDVQNYIEFLEEKGVNTALFLGDKLVASFLGEIKGETPESKSSKRKQN